MTAIVFSVLGLILTFVTVVALHEFGHYFAGRLVGVKGEVFSIGFGKPIWRKTDRNGMTWQIATLPIGGYLRFVGDENAASLSSDADAPARPGSLRAASLPAQAVVVLAGPMINFILAIVLFVMAAGFSQTVSFPWRVSAMSDLASKAGFETGDEIISVNALEIAPDTRWGDSVAASSTSDGTNYLVNRSGVLTALKAPSLNVPLIGFVAGGSPAHEAGLQLGDVILAVNGNQIVSWSELQNAVSSSEGRTLGLFVSRDDVTLQRPVTPNLQNGRWLLGLNNAPLVTLDMQNPKIQHAVSLGINRAGEVLVYTVTGLTSTLLGRGDLCELNGPITISRVAGEAIQLGPEIFLTFMAVISLGLGILNLLPIPILDGGHLLSLAIEGTTGKPLGQRAKAILFIAGVTGVAWLSITAIISDLTC